MLQILASREVEDRQSAHFLLGVVRQLAEEVVAINERSTHGRKGHADGAIAKDGTILVFFNLGLLHGIHGGLQFARFWVATRTIVAHG